MTLPVLYYARHGETDWNVVGRLQGLRDTPLNVVGRAQAARCGEILGKLLADASADPAVYDYFSSPLTRARETMEVMRTALALDPLAFRVDPRLSELSFGRWEGLTLAELRAVDPMAVAGRERDKWRFVPPGGESYEQMAARMAEWLATLDSDAVVVAHGGTARALLVLYAIAPPETAPRLDIEQGVLYRLSEGHLVCYR